MLIYVLIESKSRNCDIYPPNDDIIDGEKRRYSNNVEIMKFPSSLAFLQYNVLQCTLRPHN